MNSKNTIKLNTFINLSQLLTHGFTLDDALSLLETLESNKAIANVKWYLKEGYSFLDVLKHFKMNPLFLDILHCLFPFKGLSQSLYEAIHFVNEIERWKNLIKKQCVYPLILMVIMALFSFFVRVFLLPQMTQLYMSFGKTNQFTSYFNLIAVIPNLILFLLLCLFFIILIIFFAVMTRNRVFIELLIKVPILKYFIQMYFSLKFAFYLSKITCFFDSFYETMMYLNRYFKDKDLCFVVEKISYLLKEGHSFYYIIQQHPYFTKEFKQYFSFIIKSHQPFDMLENYCQLTFHVLEKKFMNISKIILMFVYSITGVYVLSLYSLMILPILEITNTL